MLEGWLVGKGWRGGKEELEEGELSKRRGLTFKFWYDSFVPKRRHSASNFRFMTTVSVRFRKSTGTDLFRRLLMIVPTVTLAPTTRI